jgi:hypothetical protein
MKIVKYLNTENLKNGMLKTKYATLLLFVCILCFSFTSASLGTFKQNEIVDIRILANCTNVDLTEVNDGTNTFLINSAMTNLGGQTWSYNFTNTSKIGTYSYSWNNPCVDCATNDCGNSFEVTATGTYITDVGQISVGLIYFFIIMGFGLIFLGYLLLGNPSIFVSYGGLFLMLLGSAFLYYDLHLANLYASTIAYASGAENVTSGAFLMIVKFLKLAPLIIAGVIAFASVKLLSKAIKKKGSSDGWDDDKY